MKQLIMFSLRIVHINNRKMILRRGLRPGAVTAGPAEGAQQSRWMRRGLCPSGPYSHSIAITENIHAVIMPEIPELIRPKLIRSHQVNGLPSQKAFTLVAAAVCQHAHKYGKIPAAAV